jgi:hypothetical protein
MRTTAAMTSDTSIYCYDLVLYMQQIPIRKAADDHFVTHVILLPQQLGKTAQRGTGELQHRQPPQYRQIYETNCVMQGGWIASPKSNEYFVKVIFSHKLEYFHSSTF